MVHPKVDPNTTRTVRLSGGPYHGAARAVPPGHDRIRVERPETRVPRGPDAQVVVEYAEYRQDPAAPLVFRWHGWQAVPA